MQNKVKKFITVIASASLLFSAGCTQSATHAVNDGTYEGTAKGYNGTITVSAEFKDGKMNSLEVIDSNETATVSTSAIKNTPTYIVDNQSLNVDVSTGATVTSKAIISAAGKAIEAAGGNTDQWNDDATGKHTNKVIEETTETVIVGGGLSGMAAALRLRQYGIETTILEKSDSLGGILPSLSHATQVVTDPDNEEDVPTESAADITEDIYIYGESAGNEELLDLFSSNLDSTVKWQSSILGVDFNEEYTESNAYRGNALVEYSTSGGNTGDLLVKETEVSGAKIHTKTAAIGLIYDGEKVTGVLAKASNGDIYQITADTVIIASGSTAGNESLVSSDGSSLPYYGISTNTGDLYVYGEDNDFSLTAGSAAYTFYTGFTISDTQTVDMYDAIQKAMKEGLMIVNQSGDRFVNEEDIAQDLSSAISHQDKAWVIMDQSAYNAWKTIILNNSSLTEEQRKIIRDDTCANIYSGTDLQEAAQSAGIDYSSLLNEINNFNVTCKQGADDFYGRTALGKGFNSDETCYIVELSQYGYGSDCGIDTDENLNISLKDGSSISNVYAVGSAVSNVFGEKAAAGAENAWAFVSGKTAADEIISELHPEITLKEE